MARGVDFSRADPADRDWVLYLTLALRHQNRHRTREAEVETGRQFLSAACALIARSSAAGVKGAIDVWSDGLDRLLAALTGLPQGGDKAAPRKTGVAEMVEQYKLEFGDPSTTEAKRFDREVAAWLQAGGDLRGKPPPRPPGR